MVLSDQILDARDPIDQRNDLVYLHIWYFYPCRVTVSGEKIAGGRREEDAGSDLEKGYRLPSLSNLTITHAMPSLRTAIDELQSEQSELLDKIDELRAIGVGGLVELPQIVVCGSQSSGKSSVLEAISRVRFPTKSNLCTRFATEFVLRRSPHSRIKVSIDTGKSRLDGAERQKLRAFRSEQNELDITSFSSSERFQGLMDRARDCMGLNTTTSGFSDDVLKVEISGPQQPELTLVDLPGLYHSTSSEQSA